MPGYIEAFKKLKDTQQKKLLEKTIGLTYHKILIAAEFQDIVMGSEAHEWEMGSHIIKKWTIKADSIRITVAYTAYWNVPAEAVDPSVGNLVKGVVIAAIDDHGQVQYEALTGKAYWTLKAPTAAGKNAPVESHEWSNDLLQPSRWKTARTGSGAQHLELNDYHLAVNEFPNGWSYQIKNRWTGHVAAQSSGFSSEHAAKYAALEQLAKILLSSP
jgi:hypothetical protein